MAKRSDKVVVRLDFAVCGLLDSLYPEKSKMVADIMKLDNASWTSFSKDPKTSRVQKSMREATICIFFWNFEKSGLGS